MSLFNNSLNHNCIICRVPKSGIIKAAEGYKKKIKMINFLSKTYITQKQLICKKCLVFKRIKIFVF